MYNGSLSEVVYRYPHLLSIKIYTLSFNWICVCTDVDGEGYAQYIPTAPMQTGKLNDDTLVKGRCVSELALLYNAPRAASVQCVSDTNEGGIVWCVDRGAFRKALMDALHISLHRSEERGGDWGRPKRLSRDTKRRKSDSDYWQSNRRRGSGAFVVSDLC